MSCLNNINIIYIYIIIYHVFTFLNPSLSLCQCCCIQTFSYMQIQGAEENQLSINTSSNQMQSHLQVVWQEGA